ncbi:hypothetical protein POM88_013746 [Heracleum sosnowskyi]|uniref:OVATE domain-containing protein n=1 Tax=Heracleum sosnowskyi TaxID=360622 RepID=A0AAD8J2R3_9APIA|nr:hypothetical protein POM88_013746 [Heracleum sosnowskyi]
MPSNSQILGHISKKSKPNDKKPFNIPAVPTGMFLNTQSPSALSPPNVNVLDGSLFDQMKSSSNRLFFDHSSKMLIDTPRELNGTCRRLSVNLSPSKSVEKQKMVTSSEPKEQTMKEVLSLYPETKFFESMAGMVRTRLECNLKVDSGYLEELLALYLVRNEESLHGHIFSAYLRVMVDLSHTFG